MQIVATVALPTKRVYKDVHDRVGRASVAARCADMRPQLPVFANRNLYIRIKILVLFRKLFRTTAVVLTLRFLYVHSVVVHKFRLSHEVVHC